jgi:hypothetical protein
LLSLLTSNPPTFPNIKSGSSAFEFQLTRLWLASYHLLCGLKLWR